MPRTPIRRPPRDPPEPPALRERVLQVSSELLAEGGLAALSMREVARRSGVTHQAPYHHFPDKESIVAELITRAFDALAGRLSRANELAAPHGPRAALLAACEAYLGFALEQPAVFRLMFRPELCDASRFPLASEAADRAHGELERLVSTVHHGPCDAALASLYWAQVHGLACLALDGPLELRLGGEAERRAHLRAVTERFVSMVLGQPGDPGS